jgi:dTDP-4-dehydrorhamnose reductase
MSRAHVKALVVGATGFVGRRLMAELGDAGIGAHRSGQAPDALAFDAGRDRLADLLARAPQDLTHVFVAQGSPDPELCARDWEGTAKVAVAGVIAIAEDCFRAGLTPVVFSTDYVFHGARGFWEDDARPEPLTAYGRQKAEVEAWLRAQARPWLMLRLSKVVSDRMEPRNILAEWVGNIFAGEEIRCAWDQVLSPVAAEDVAGAAVRLAGMGAEGVFNLAGPEAFSRLALLQLLAAHLVAARPDLRPRITPCRLAELHFSEQRPLDTSLQIGKLQRAVAWPFRPMAQLCRTLAATAAAKT